MFHRRSRTGVCTRRFQSSHPEQGVWCAHHQHSFHSTKSRGTNRYAWRRRAGQSDIAPKRQRMWMKSKVPSPYVHSLCASSISNRTFGGTLYRNACQSRSERNKLSHTIRVVLERGLSCSVSRVCPTGGVWTITGSDDLARSAISAIWHAMGTGFLANLSIGELIRHVHYPSERIHDLIS